MNHRLKLTNPSLNIAIILALCSTTQGALAQSQSANEHEYLAGNQQHVQQALSILPRVHTNENTIYPSVKASSDPIQPGLTQGEDWLKVLNDTLKEDMTPSTLSEGSFVLNRKGILVKAPNDLYIFVPDKSERANGEGPVLLMPCKSLERLEHQWIGQSIIISGEIFTYHNRNQLLISDYRIFSSTQEPSQSTSSDSTTQPESSPSSIEDDPEIDDLINELEFDTQSAASKSVADDQSTNRSTFEERKQEVESLEISSYKEGSLLIRQPSRIVRNSTGAWTIVLDNDSPDTQDSPEFVIEPCLLLMQMEQIAMDTGDERQLLISGRVYIYKDTLYLLPTLFQRLEFSELNSLQ